MDVKTENEKQKHGKNDFTTNLGEVTNKTTQKEPTLDELEDKEPSLLLITVLINKCKQQKKTWVLKNWKWLTI